LKKLHASSAESHHPCKVPRYNRTTSSPKDHDTTWFCTTIRLGFHNLQFIFVLSTCDYRPATITYLYEQLTQLEQQTCSPWRITRSCLVYRQSSTVHDPLPQLRSNAQGPLMDWSINNMFQVWGGWYMHGSGEAKLYT